MFSAGPSTFYHANGGAVYSGTMGFRGILSRAYSSLGSQRASVITGLPRNPPLDAADLVTETRNLSHTRRGLRGKPAMTRVFLRGCEK